MISMWEGYKSLKPIDKSNIYLSKLYNMVYLFNGWESLGPQLIEKGIAMKKYNIYIILENKPFILVFMQISLNKIYSKKLRKTYEINWLLNNSN